MLRLKFLRTRLKPVSLSRNLNLSSKNSINHSRILSNNRPKVSSFSQLTGGPAEPLPSQTEDWDELDIEDDLDEDLEILDDDENQNQAETLDMSDAKG